MPKVPKDTKLEYVLLGLVNHEPMSGYDIKRRIALEIGFFWPEVSFSQIYPILKKLEKKETVSMKEEKTGNRPSRKVYSITSKGKKELIEWLKEPVEIERTNHSFTIFQEFLLKLYFSGAIPQENVIENINELEKWLKQTKTLFDHYEVSLEQVLHSSDDHKYYLLSMQFGKIIYESLLNWTKNAKELLE
ncbi:MAG: PadR family transcriptional regulator [Candidatus Heimdallarchaeota archaeon]|nr:MAG: PadR family transcriptional regulator [Candidatus Heimdallarchaeota archaeon]